MLLKSEHRMGREDQRPAAAWAPPSSDVRLAGVRCRCVPLKNWDGRFDIVGHFVERPRDLLIGRARGQPAATIDIGAQLVNACCIHPDHPSSTVLAFLPSACLTGAKLN